MELNPEELELAALSCMREPASVRRAQDMGVSSDSFQVAAHAAAWEYLAVRAARDESATRDDVMAATGVSLGDATDIETFCGELAKRTAARLARASMGAHIRALETDPMPAITGLTSDLQKIISAHTVAHSRSFDGDQDDWLAQVVASIDAKRAGKQIGVPTGLPILDETGESWKSGDLIAIIGATNAGKSTMLLHFGVSAWMAGYKVLFLSPESTISDVKWRWDPMVARRLYGIELSNMALRNATMTDEQLEAYRAYSMKLALDGRQDWETKDSGDKGVFSVEDIIAYTRQYRPDVVCLDGFHLIRSSQGGKSWETIKAAAETIKGLAQDMGIVVIAGSQARRDAVIAADDTPELGDTAYGLALIEAANKVVALAAKRNDPTMRVFKLPKNRDGPVITARQYLLFDVDKGNIAQYRPDVNAATGEVDFGVR